MAELTALASVGRTLAEFAALSVAELALLQACALGETADVGELLPAEKGPSEEVRVRAAFIRFLALGGDSQAPVHERGVRLRGASISGQLDLEGCTVVGDLSLRLCRFDMAPIFDQAHVLQRLFLDASWLPGLQGNGLRVEGDISLCKGFVSQGEICLIGARIGGSMGCDGAQLTAGDNGNGTVLSCYGMQVGGSVFFRNGFVSRGEIRLHGVQIGGDLECDGAQLTGLEEGKGTSLNGDRLRVGGSIFLRNDFISRGEIRLLGAQIGGDLDCAAAQFSRDGDAKGKALNCERMRVAGVASFRRAKVEGAVSFGHAEVGVLIDGDLSHWPLGRLTLDGFCFGMLGGGSSTDAKQRIAWLRSQTPEHLYSDFRPQPWTHLIKVLRGMGHKAEAREVGQAYEQQRRRAGRLGRWWQPNFALHFLYGLISGYGYQPLRAASWMIGMCLLSGAFYFYAATQGVFAPSDPLVFDNPHYENCRPDGVAGQLPYQRKIDERVGNWFWCATLVSEYASFSPFVYSLDLILPLVDLQQERTWAPIVATPRAEWYAELVEHWSLNHLVRLWLWLEILFGWAVSSVLLAVLSGLVKPDGTE